MFEYARHEGDYGLRNILSAARAAEHRGDNYALTNILNGARTENRGGR